MLDLRQLFDHVVNVDGDPPMPARLTGRYASLVFKRLHCDGPATTFLPHQARGRNTGISKEGLVETVLTGHLPDGMSLDAIDLHWRKEKR